MEDLVINPNFWQGKNVLLTGHTGFKGSWLSLWLHLLGARVTGFSLEPPTHPSLFQEAKVGKILLNDFRGDIRDLNVFSKIIQQVNPEIVIHMAAQSLVRNSYADPVQTYATNVMGTVHLFEAIRKTPSVKVILNITSDKCYENNKSVRGHHEGSPLGGRDPYSSSKGCAELISSSYRHSYLQDADIAMATARAGNVVGGGDWASDRIVPDAIRAFISEEPLLVRNPNAVRPWQHVLEPLAGYLQLCEQLAVDSTQFAEAWNFGASDGDAQTVSQLVNFIAQSWGERAKWQHDEALHQPYEESYLKLDCSKARDKLGWKPRWSLQKAIEQSTAWYKAWYQGEDTFKLSLSQIETYQQVL